VTATTRNWRTVNELIKLAESEWSELFFSSFQAPLLDLYKLIFEGKKIPSYRNSMGSNICSHMVLGYNLWPLPDSCLFFTIEKMPVSPNWKESIPELNMADIQYSPEDQLIMFKTTGHNKITFLSHSLSQTGAVVIWTTCKKKICRL
jgi:hypothetical protein